MVKKRMAWYYFEVISMGSSSGEETVNYRLLNRNKEYCGCGKLRFPNKLLTEKMLKEIFNRVGK